AVTERDKRRIGSVSEYTSWGESPWTTRRASSTHRMPSAKQKDPGATGSTSDRSHRDLEVGGCCSPAHLHTSTSYTYSASGSVPSSSSPPGAMAGIGWVALTARVRW